ncbi:hypothetical protein [Aurantibacillus circumpalustris]|uniref:hypothetical protein n=1 Tax=Aurantibacillus circumpalustris TaxID=3036359 RepID=UPI00295A7C81|nr:hypothetical protein [Aurantibacillus circumpalustris]
MNKSKLVVAVSFLFFAFLIFVSCDKKVGKLPEETPPTGINCDEVTYTKDIKSIIANNCSLAGCHDGNNSNPRLETYSLLKDRADAGRIKERVLDASPTRMPPVERPALTSEEKELISCWLENGKKE